MGSTKLLLQKYRRNSPRIHSLGSISLNYEGHSEEVAARPPDVSARGMFINTARNFPEGAVLNLKFLLSLSGVEIQTRGEVRYCLKGVGIGVEFVGISPDAVEEIEREIELCANHSRSKKKRTRRSTALSR
jgi:hypothetical protein